MNIPNLFDIMFVSTKDKMKMVDFLINVMNRKKKIYHFIYKSDVSYHIYNYIATDFINILRRLFRCTNLCSKIRFNQLIESEECNNYQIIYVGKMCEIYSTDYYNGIIVEYYQYSNDIDVDKAKNNTNNITTIEFKYDKSYQFSTLLFESNIIMNISDIINKYQQATNTNIILHFLWLLQQLINKDCAKCIITRYLVILKNEYITMMLLDN